MSDAMLYGMLYFGGIALVLGLVAVVVQAVVLSLATRLGTYLLASVPMVALGAGALGVLLSKRDLHANLLSGGMTAEGAGALWVTRFANLLLLALALAKLAHMLFSFGAKARLAERTEAGSANRRLFMAFIAYAFCSLILPMVFGTKPAFSHEGLIAVPMFAAAYLARGEPIDHFLASFRWALLLIIVASLCVAVVMPQMAVSKYLTGLIPGLNVRLWGLTSHPNYMGALAITLMPILWLSPFRRGWLNKAAWALAALALFLTQSKTNWLAGAVVLGALLVFRHGRDEHGRLQIGVWILLALGAAMLAASLLFIDVGVVMDRFLASDVGNGLSSLTGRTRVWEAAIDMWLDSPWFGYGPEAWSPLHRTELGVPFATQAHNQLLEALSWGGLAYAVPMIIYFVLLLRGAIRSSERTRGVSVALILVIAIRCVSEAPFGIGNMTSGDTVMHLLLFMLVVREVSQKAAMPASTPRGQSEVNGFKAATVL